MKIQNNLNLNNIYIHEWVLNLHITRNYGFSHRNRNATQIYLRTK